MRTTVCVRVPYVRYMLDHQITCYDDCCPDTIQVTEAPQIPRMPKQRAKNSMILDSIHVNEGRGGGHKQMFCYLTFLTNTRSREVKSLLCLAFLFYIAFIVYISSILETLDYWIWYQFKNQFGILPHGSCQCTNNISTARSLLRNSSCCSQPVFENQNIMHGFEI